MKHLKSYESFDYSANEEINIKKALIGGAFAGIVGTGLYHTSQIYNYAEQEDTEVISGQKFNQYDVYVSGETFDLNISDDGVISAEWSEEHGSGKNRETRQFNCVTIPNETKEIWYDTKTFESGNGVFVSIKSISGGEKINISELSIKEETDTYVIYDTPMFSSIDYIIMDKGHTSGEEFTIQNKIGNWICDDIGHNVYIFALKNFGGGKGGGGGSGGKY
jgi:hypothetical protein